jgi:hypothetical protein
MNAPGSTIIEIGLWLARPVWRPLAWLLAATLCLLPGRLFSDELSNARLKGDDFAFLAECRGGDEPLRNLFQPHNAHVVPLFRLLTATTARMSGSLPDVALVQSWVTQSALVGLMLCSGAFVARETRSMPTGLATMIALGVSSVVFPATTWYAAGQTLWAAFFAALGLLMLQCWRTSGRVAWQIVASLIAFLAPFWWGGGVAVGFAGAAYLFCALPVRSRRTALWPIAATILAVVAASPFGFSAWRSAETGSALSVGNRLARTATHVSQAVPESLLFQNLGLDVSTTPAQGIALVMAFLAFRLACRRTAWKLNTLEAPGLVLVVLPYTLAFGLRAQFEFSSLRDLGWYDTLPQLGFVLIVAGAFQANRLVEPGKPRLPQRWEFLALVGFAVLMFGLNQPRLERILIAAAPEMSVAERARFLTPHLQRLRAVYLESELAAAQRRALARLVQVKKLAAKWNLSRATLRGRFGVIQLPGWPQGLSEFDALDVIALRESGGAPLTAEMTMILRQELTPEPPPSTEVFGRSTGFNPPPNPSAPARHP